MLLQACGPTSTRAPEDAFNAAVEAGGPEPRLPDGFDIRIPPPASFSVGMNQCYGGSFTLGQRYEFWCADGHRFIYDHLEGVSAAAAEQRLIVAFGKDASLSRGTVSSSDGLGTRALAFEANGLGVVPEAAPGAWRSLAMTFEFGGATGVLQCLAPAESFEAQTCANALLTILREGLDPTLLDRFAPDEVEVLGQPVNTDGICKRPRPNALHCFGVELAWDRFDSAAAAEKTREAMLDQSVQRFEAIGGEVVTRRESACEVAGAKAQCKAVRVVHPAPGAGRVELEVHYGVGRVDEAWSLAVCSFDLAQVSEDTVLPEPCSAILADVRLP